MVIFVDFCSESNVMTLLVFDGFMEGKREHGTWISSLRWTRRGNGEKLTLTKNFFTLWCDN